MWWCAADGKTLVTLIDFTRASGFLGNEYQLPVPEHPAGRNALNIVDIYRARYHKRLESPLLLILSNTRHAYDCMEQQDRIYALLGVQSEDMKLPGIEIAY
jgi:hypothetical protein